MADVTRQQRHVVAACYLGWTLDAFDYFIMSLTLDEVAKAFHTDRTALSFAFTVTLVMRPLGAFIFGLLADRFGRRPALMASVLLYSVLEFASAFAPTLTIFLVLRGLFGLAMGGEWGVGASLTMESIPSKWRGPVSGLLQAGYPSGYLLATLLNWAAIGLVGWRGLFMLGALPALLVLYIRSNVPESPDWETRATPTQRASVWDLFNVLFSHLGLVAYAVLMMTAFNVFSHGTQDLYKSFLTVEHRLSLGVTTTILICMNIAAIGGGIICASLSQRVGRRTAIVVAALLSLPVLPLRAFSNQPLAIGIGAFAMQLCVQGAWGVIPAHLNELSPAAIRGTFPGLTYTIGNLMASVTLPIQSGLADTYFHKNLSWPLALVVGTAAVVIALLVGFGREARDVRMGRERVSGAAGRA
jgi:SHS family lactate transporter-like MFS transporter